MTKEWVLGGIATQEESREEVKPWISGLERNGELISTGKTDTSKVMRWKSSHVHNQKEGIFEKKSEIQIRVKN